MEGGEASVISSWRRGMSGELPARGQNLGATFSSPSTELPKS